MPEWFYMLGQFFRGLLTPSSQEKGQKKKEIDQDIENQLDIKFGKKK